MTLALGNSPADYTHFLLQRRLGCFSSN